MEKAVDYQLNYSALDRFMHRLAFGMPAIQMTAADIEANAFGGQYKDVDAARPIFITSLPRAGTTLVLEALHRFPTVAVHTYRDMPFVMAPLLWSRLGGAFHKKAELQERAHGDGMQVGFDSPEAFEEILWRQFWPEKYTATGIDLWQTADIQDEARHFFVDHMKKIIALRRPDRRNDARYVSKNNGNMARLDILTRMFPGARIVVPMRDPINHAGSLLRQHRNFTEMHAKEPFVQRYMADLGHYEFGALHRPIAFDGLAALIDGRDPMTLDYWLAYWIAAFEYVATRLDGLILLAYDPLCTEPGRHLPTLCHALDIADEGRMEEVVSLFRAPGGGPADAPCDPVLKQRAETLYERLRAAAIGG